MKVKNRPSPASGDTALPQVLPLPPHQMLLLYIRRGEKRLKPLFSSLSKGYEIIEW
jgi:hypothetical protein